MTYKDLTYKDINSAAEINAYAEQKKQEGDMNSVRSLSGSLGLDEEDIEAYISGEEENLATETMYALAKIEQEEKEIEPYEIMQDWITYIKECIVEDAKMAARVLQKDRTIKGCIAEILKWSFKNAKPVDQEVLNMCNIKYKATLGIPGIATAKQLIQKYYK